MEIEFQVDLAGFEAWRSRVESAVPRIFDELLERGGNLIASVMREKAPVKTGFLRDSIVTRRAPDTVSVGPTASYASFVEFGTRPHIIYPVTANVLAFEVGGKTVFAKHVNHPGFPGRFFVRGTSEEVWPRIQSLAEEMIRLLLEMA